MEYGERERTGHADDVQLESGNWNHYERDGPALQRDVLPQFDRAGLGNSGDRERPRGLARGPMGSCPDGSKSVHSKRLQVRLYAGGSPASPSARDAWCASLDNLYYAANVQANLFASKLQVDDYDLDMDILQGIPAAAIDETGLSYLWSSVLVQNQYSYVPSNGWMDRFNGQSDPRVMQALSNMQDRQGATFMSTNQTELNQVVQH